MEDDDHWSQEGHPNHPGTEDDITLGFYAERIIAIQEVLVEKGVVGDGEVQREIDSLESRSPADGANIVARAWKDPGFKARLLAEPKAAIKELGYSLTHESELAVLENTEVIHHLVVCTLCSCYPTTLLGRPPDWYKSATYRSRAVIDPRGVMREFGLELDDEVEVRVVDSTADMRYLVLPRRPVKTEGVAQEQLSKLVTRNSMIGVANPLPYHSINAQPGD